MNQNPHKKRTVCVHLDAHVHVYPSYDLTAFLEAAIAHMPRCSPTDQHVLLLAERRDCAFFQFLAQDEISLPSERFCITAWDPGGAVKIRHLPSQRDLWLVAGRQYATAERLEVCSLFSDLAIPDGRPLLDTIADIRDAGAIAALNWGFGKWLFSRAKVVDSLLRHWPAEDLAVGDTSLRPVFWPTPGPMAQAPTLGRRVLHGSDPLPPAFEETRAGQWGDLTEAALSEDLPLRSRILSVLRDDDLRPVGRRSGPLQFLRRML